MNSIKDIYKIGLGPSSSHTMGPAKACEIFKNENPDAERFKVILYGSLSKTGKGHGTDIAIKNTLSPKSCEVEFYKDDIEIKHPNTLDLIAIKDGKEVNKMRVYSIGGGDIAIEGRAQNKNDNTDTYNENNFDEIKSYCKKNNLSLLEYILKNEGESIKDDLQIVWDTMKKAVEEGLHKEGTLKGGLNVKRKAHFFYISGVEDPCPEMLECKSVCSFAYAVAEQNADNGVIVTAPTCGSCGVVPAVLYYFQKKKKFSDEKMIEALAVAGIFGALAKKNASVSGAECGCQAEIGVACSMAAAGMSYLFKYNINQIECAAEIALEHFLGLTCDPIGGLVQIPCIERNAVAAMRAITATNIAYFLTGVNMISFDMVLKSMYKTGIDINKKYRETSEGGLAEIYHL